MNSEKFNLFIYGSLRDPSIFKSVCGYSFTLKPSQIKKYTLFAELAILPGHRRVSPDNVYYYAVVDINAKIEGMIIYDVPLSAILDIDKYEGNYYERESVRVNTAEGPTEAIAYLAKPKSMKTKFGDRFHVNLIHELWLRKRIETFFEKHTRPGEKSLDANIERRARRELMGTTERDLVVSHLGSDVVSDYYLEHEFDRPIPSIRNIQNDPEVQPFTKNYLGLVIKHVLLNQFEQYIHERFRYELERLLISHRFFTRSTSLLIALTMINLNKGTVELIIQRGLETMPPENRFDIIDYVKYAISAADSAFDARIAKAQLERVRANRQPGLIPIGAELELSNLGFKAVRPGVKNEDKNFNGFKYFNDFGLDILTWKLGGYIDDHSGQSTPSRQGFLELAPGRLNVAGEISKPATSDPWLMNQLIHEITEFYPIAPHSLHLSFQLRRKQYKDPKILPPSFVKCLLALAGGTQQSSKGKLWVSRMNGNEIQQNIYGDELVFARRSKRQYKISDEYDIQKKPFYALPQVQQYKFIRLERRANYEPSIMALKGLQLAYNPADYLTAAQLKQSLRLRQQYEEIKAWSGNPEPISRRTRGRFLDAIKKGLMSEYNHRPAHKLHYIDWALGAIDIQLRLFNKEVERQKAFEKQVELRNLIEDITTREGLSQ